MSIESVDYVFSEAALDSFFFLSLESYTFWLCVPSFHKKNKQSSAFLICCLCSSSLCVPLYHMNDRQCLDVFPLCLGNVLRCDPLLHMHSKQSLHTDGTAYVSTPVTTQSRT